MIVPRMLCRLNDPPHDIVEVSDPRPKHILCTEGHPYTDDEAEQLGLKAYLDETGWGATARAKGEKKVTEAQAIKAAEAAEAESKAVAQAETEDKAVAGPEDAKADEPEADSPPKGVSMPPEARRQRGR